jgi:hypothetical protein
MSIATGTVSVNAAFLQEIKEDDREFRQLLCQAGEMLGPTHLSTVEPRRILEHLCRLRDQLALHFTLEEAYGYFEDAIGSAPQLSDQAEQLRNQHQTLFGDFCRTVDAAEQLTTSDADDHARARLARMFHNFRADMQLHEAREHDLILAAFNEDYGAGD